MFPPRFRLPLSNLAAFAVGAGLAAAWILGREPANAEKARAAETDTRPRLVSATPSDSTGRPPAWKSKSGSEKTPPSSGTAVKDDLEESEIMLRGMHAQLRHQARSKVLQLAYRLGLDDNQWASLQAEVLADLDAPGVVAIPFDPEGLVEAMVIRMAMDLLTDPQREQLARYRESRRRAETELHALAETNDIARVIELTEEQRSALIQKFADRHISIDEFDEFIHYGEPIDTKATAADGTPTTVFITESRIEMPVFAYRNSWLADILSEDQLANFRMFQAKQRELEKLKEDEMRATEEE